MAILKCKMCGGDMEIAADKTFGTCEYCGSTMTLPKVDDEQRAAIFNRGNHFRRTGEFDKALAVYERIVAEDDTDAEAHWCCALCRFGIEYVEDPATYEWLPTCHRASFDSFLEDVDYLAAVEHSDGITKRQYQKDAAKIADVQRGILATSQNTEPYDVFISYKELDADGNRTRDSILAQDIYYQLTEQGRRVFFSRISLEDVPGTQYEPYIFAALNSAKVMIVVGTSADNLNAVWVKNEWSRFLSMMRKDRSKLLLPCYRDMDPYDLPEQLSVLMSYDMGKIGFIQDLIRGVNKVLDADKVKYQVKETVKEMLVVNNTVNANAEPLLKRAFIFLEDGNWQEADSYCEKVLDINPENARAYLGKLMAEQHIRKQADLKNCDQPFDGRNNYQKAIRFGDKALQNELAGYIRHINDRNENNRLTGIYNNAQSIMDNPQSEEKFKEAAKIFKSLSGFKDADALAEKCLEEVEKLKRERLDKEEKIKSTIGTFENSIKEIQSQIAKENAELQSLGLFASGKKKAIRERIAELQKKLDREKNAKTDFLSQLPIRLQIIYSPSTLSFGRYPQKKNGDEGRPIEWCLLAKEDNRILVISEYALDCQPYNTKNTSVTWETCSLRIWMNDTFLNEAFSEEEQAIIQSTKVSADKNPEYSTNPGNATTDKVFLLSINEAVKYFTSDEDRKCVPTEYAIAQGAYTNSDYTKNGEATCCWWLRSPGWDQLNTAALVNVDGLVSYNGYRVNNNDCVRPAMWISIE